MKLKLQKNDAFRVINDITRDVIVDVEKTLLRRMKDEQMIFGEMEDCGKSLDDIRAINGMVVEQFVPLLFRNVEMTEEIPELIKHVVIMADGSDDPCPQCGCELERETDGFGRVEWTDTKCSNGECDFADTNEPDWDLKRKR